MSDKETRQGRLKTLVEAQGLTWSVTDGKGGEIKICGRARDGEFKRIVFHPFRKVPQQIVRNIRAKFGIPEEDFYSGTKPPA